MKTRFALATMVLSALSLPAFAGSDGPFEAEIDCDGIVTAPATVPFTLRFESQAQQAQAIDLTVRLTLPGGRSMTLREATINLRANQDRAIDQTLNLRDNAPNGEYTITLVATSNNAATFDTCSFDVN